MITPYIDVATGITFTPEQPDSFTVGLVKNGLSPACVDPPTSDQKLGTGANNPFTTIRRAGPIRAIFPTALTPPVTISVEFQTVPAGAAISLRLFGASGVEIATTVDTTLLAEGRCGDLSSSPLRVRKRVTASSVNPVAYAVMAVEGAQTFVLDNFEASSRPFLEAFENLVDVFKPFSPVVPLTVADIERNRDAVSEAVNSARAIPGPSAAGTVKITFADLPDMLSTLVNVKQCSLLILTGCAGLLVGHWQVCERVFGGGLFCGLLGALDLFTANPTFERAEFELSAQGDEATVGLFAVGDVFGVNVPLRGSSAFSRVLVLEVSGNVLRVRVERIGRLDPAASSFGDVPVAHAFFIWIRALFDARITGGCSSSAPLYCPNDPITRGQMAVFLVRGIHGADYEPPAPTGTVFVDVRQDHPFASWIEQLAREGITGGCSTNPPEYCPERAVTREEMAVFLLRAEHGPAYDPPAATGITFSDVPGGDVFASWIEQLARDGITGGCALSPPQYCPDAKVTRGQMAVFLARVFGLPL